MQSLSSLWPPGKVNQALFFFVLGKFNFIFLISVNTYQSFRKKFCKCFNQKENKISKRTKNEFLARRLINKLMNK